MADDYRNTLTGSGILGSVPTGGSASGVIEVSGDLDVFATTLINGLTYTFEQNGGVNPYLRLLGGSGSLLSSDDAGNGFNALITYTAQSTDTYFLQAGGHGSQTGFYNVHVSEGLGSAGNDVITGTNLDDAINGGGGHDRISGLAGDDWLVGGAGNDSLDGGDYEDDGRRVDSLYGGDGNDVLSAEGADGGDLLDGGAGNDILSNGYGSDTGDDSTLYGGDGDDHIFGYGALISGEAGNDILQGSRASVYGDAGNDVIGLGEFATAVEFEVAIADGSTSHSLYTAADFIL